MCVPRLLSGKNANKVRYVAHRADDQPRHTLRKGGREGAYLRCLLRLQLHGPSVFPRLTAAVGSKKSISSRRSPPAREAFHPCSRLIRGRVTLQYAHGMTLACSTGTGVGRKCSTWPRRCCWHCSGFLQVAAPNYRLNRRGARLIAVAHFRVVPAQAD